MLYDEEMHDIQVFCKKHHIITDKNHNSYYFKLNGQKYRVSNHTIDESNKRAFNRFNGRQFREIYHPEGEDPNVVYIIAGKRKIKRIYNDLRMGRKLDKRGNAINI